MQQDPAIYFFLFQKVVPIKNLKCDRLTNIDSQSFKKNKKVNANFIFLLITFLTTSAML